MGKNNRKFVIDLEITTKDAEKQFDSAAKNIKNKLASIGDAADKMKVFKDVAEYIGDIDAELDKLKSIKGLDFFNKTFGDLDKNLKHELESVFNTTSDNLRALDQLRTKFNGRTKDNTTKDEAKALRDEIVELYNLIGAGDKVDISNKLGVENMLKKSKEALESFATVWGDVNKKISQGITFGGGTGIADSGIENIVDQAENASNELQDKINKIQKEIDELENIKKQYNDIMSKWEKSKSSTELFDANTFTPETSVDGVRKLIQEFDTLKQEINSAEVGSLEYYDALNKLVDVSIRLSNSRKTIMSDDELKKTFRDTDPSNKEIGIHELGVLSSYVNTQPNEVFKNTDKSIKQIDKFIEAKKEEIEVVKQANDIHGQESYDDKTKDDFKETQSEYDELINKVKQYKSIREQLNDTSITKEEKLDLKGDADDLEVQIAELSKVGNKAEEIVDILQHIDVGKIDSEGTLSKLSNVLGIEMPQDVQKFENKVIETTEYVKGLEAAIRDMFNAASKASDVEYKILIDGQNIDTRRGQDGEVSLKTQAEAYLANLTKDIDIDAHSHQGSAANIDYPDIKSAISKYYNGLTKMSAIIGANDITTLDLSKVKIEDAYTALEKIKAVTDKSPTNIIRPEKLNKIFASINPEYTNIAQKWDESQFGELANHIYEIKQSSEQTLTPLEKFKNLLITITNGKIDFSKYSKEFENFSVDNAADTLNKIMQSEGIKEDGEILQVDRHITQGSVNDILVDIQRQKDAYAELRQTAKLTYEDIRAEVQKYLSADKVDNSFFDKFYHPEEMKRVRDDLADAAANVLDIDSLTNKIAGDFGVEQKELDLIRQTGDAYKDIIDAKKQSINIEDDASDVARENGLLEDKLDLLREIADEYGSQITNKKRDRYEELNQKDMDTGLTSKEADRFSDLGDEISEADESLEKFGATYEKIIIKLANGRTKEILPDDKGLRDLFKYSDSMSYDEFGGKEIVDVEFVRKSGGIDDYFETEIPTAVNKANAAIEEAENKFKEFEALTDKVNYKSFYDASDNVEIGKYIQLLDDAKSAFDELGQQGLLTSDQLESINDMYNKAIDHLQDETKYYTGYGNSYGDYDYSYESEYENAQLENEHLTQENAELREQLNRVEESAKNAESAIKELNTESENIGNNTTDVNKLEGSLENVEAQAKQTGDALENIGNDGIKSVDELREMYDTLKAAHDELPRRKIEEPDYYKHDWGNAKRYADFEYDGEDMIPYGLSFEEEVEATNNLLDKNREAIKSTYKKIRDMQNAVKKHGGHLDDEVYDDRDIENAKDGLMGLFEKYYENGGDLDNLDIKMTKPFQALLEQTKLDIADRDVQLKAYKAETEEIIANNRAQIESYEKLYAATDKAFEASKSKDEKYKYKSTNLPSVFTGWDYNEYDVLEHYDSFEETLKRMGIEIPQAAEKAIQSQQELKSEVEQTTDAIKEQINVEERLDNVDTTVDASIEKETAAVEEQTAAYKELETAKKSAEVYDNAQTSVIDDVSKEFADLEKLEEKLKEVKSAIELKTQAFKDEGDTVGNVVRQEIMVLDSLSTYLDTIYVVINSIVDGLNRINNTKLNSIQDVDSKVVVDGNEATSNKEYALNTTLLETNRILGDILKATNNDDDTRLLITELEGAVLALRNVADGIVERQQLTTTDASKRIDTSDKRAYLSGIAAQAVNATNPDDVKIEKIYAAADGLVAISGAAKNAEGVWEGFSLRINDANKAVSVSTGNQTLYAKSLNEAASAAENAATKTKTAIGSSITGIEDRYISLNYRASEYTKDNEASVLYSKVTKTTEQYTEALNELKNAKIALDKAPNDEDLRVAFVKAKTDCQNLGNELKGLLDDYDKFKQKHTNVKDIDAGKYNFDSLEDRKQALQEYVQRMYGAEAKTKDFNQECTELNFTLKNSDGTISNMSASFDKLKTSIGSAAAKADKFESAFSGFIGGVSKEMGKLLRYFTARFGIDEFFQAFRTGVQYVRDIDSALTELKKVTSETDATYERFLQTASKTAGVVGSTVAELTQMSAEWARLKYLGPLYGDI